MKLFIDHLGSIFENYEVEFRVHAVRRMFQRRISHEDVGNVIKHGYIIDEYMDDFPFPSFLINGKSAEDRPIHLVVGVNSDERILIIITAYEPDGTKWKDNFSKRVL